MVKSWTALGADPMDESSKAQLQATLDMIPAFTWLAAPSGALLFVNSRCADYLGLPQDHPLRFGIDTGAAWDSHIPFLHPDDHEEMRRVGSDNLRTGGTAEASCRIRDAQGNYRWFLSRTEPLRGNNGTILYWIGINLDIDERKQAEFYLAEGQRLAHSGSWTFTPAGFEQWSPELFAIHGLDPAAKAPTFAEYMALVHPDDRAFVAQEIRAILSERRGFEFTKRIVRPDGSIRHVRCVGTPAANSGLFPRFVGTGIDEPREQPAVCRWGADAPYVTNRPVRTHDPLRELESATLRQYRPNFLRDEISIVRMHERHVFREGWCLRRRIEAVDREQLGRPLLKARRGERPASRMCEPLSLCQVELGLLAFVNVEVDPEPVEDRSVVPTERLRATEEPAVIALSVPNSTTRLSRAARPQIVRPDSPHFFVIVRMQKGDMRIPRGACVDSEPKRVILRQSEVVRTSRIHEEERARWRRKPRECRNHVQRGLQLSFR